MIDWLIDVCLNISSATNADGDQMETTSAKAQPPAGPAAKRTQKGQQRQAKAKAEESKAGVDSQAVNNESQIKNEKQPKGGKKNNTAKNNVTLKNSDEVN